jgi:hypothetical protein
VFLRHLDVPLLPGRHDAGARQIEKIKETDKIALNVPFCNLFLPLSMPRKKSKKVRNLKTMSIEERK